MEIGFILIIFGVLGLLLGIIAPKKAIFWGKRSQRTRGKVIFTYITVILIGLVGGVIIMDLEKSTADGVANDSVKTQENTDTNIEDNKTSINYKEQIESVQDDLNVHFIDVGQGDAALLEYSNDENDYNILIDTGDWDGNESVDYLQDEDISNIDLLVGSHPHADHIGQMDKVMDEVDVDEVWMSGDNANSDIYDRVMDTIDEEEVDYKEPRAEESYSFGPLEIDVLSPESGELTGNLNDDSIVMKVTYNDVDFMFTGDAEEDAERSMVKANNDLSADILKVGHHGSYTSSTSSFVDEVNPDTAIVSVGEDNEYDHPSDDIVSRFNKQGDDLHMTKDDGNIVVKTDGNDYAVETEK